jgi:hypothetical protein
MDSKYVIWGSIFGIMIGAGAGTVEHSTSFGIGLGVAIAVIVALAWSALDRTRRTSGDAGK